MQISALHNSHAENDIVFVESEIKEKIVVAEIAPATRVAIGELFSLPPNNYEAELANMLYSLGFSYVFDTAFGADLVTSIEIPHFLKQKNVMFNSCCIGFRLWAKRNPELYSLLSPLVSPNMAVGSTIKNYWAKKNNIKKEDIVVVGIMPCTIKKQETKEKMPDGTRFVDYVLTTVELARWAKKRGIYLNPPGKNKNNKSKGIIYSPSREGLIFGATGGVSESLLVNLSVYLGEPLEFKELRNDNGILKKTYKIGEKNINIAKAFGFPNISHLLKDPKEKSRYNFIEAMACPFGCVGGPGQPRATTETIKKRAEVLRKSAEQKNAKNSFENKELEGVLKWAKSLPENKLRDYFYLPDKRSH